MIKKSMRVFHSKSNPKNAADLQQREAVFCLVFDVGQKQVVIHRHQGLRQHGVLAGTQKGLDLQVLLDPFEKQLYLSAGLVYLGYRRCCRPEIIRKECQRLLPFFIVIPDQSVFF